MADRTVCPACQSERIELITALDSIPVNSCLLLESSDMAQAFPTGRMAFSLCRSCGFCFNAAYQTDSSEYSARYEETQACSDRFVDFARSLAARWVERHHLAGKTVLEIGCGSMGEFLQFMVDAGIGRGIGIDPALNVERISHPRPDRFEWIPDFYSPTHADLAADAIVCRHTLEHIPDVFSFMQQIRSVIGDRTETVVLFELPDVARILDEVAFWDVYYEHCSYFSAGSLARLFRATGFEPVDVSREYGDQYLVIEARPSTVPASGDSLAVEDDLDLVRFGAAGYRDGYGQLRARWDSELLAAAERGDRTVIWGGGSKGVSFLTNVRSEAIDYVVDINPSKHGFYMAGTGQQVVGPEFLVDYRPDLVILMNPIYVDDVQADLDRLGVESRLLAL